MCRKINGKNQLNFNVMEIILGKPVEYYNKEKNELSMNNKLSS